MKTQFAQAISDGEANEFLNSLAGLIEAIQETPIHPLEAKYYFSNARQGGDERSEGYLDEQVRKIIY